jgi:AsmA protein
MQGILDNPDGAYAKLREMGKGLFGPNGGGLGGLLGSLTGNPPASGKDGNNSPGGGLVGNIGQALGNLFQQPGRGGSRSIPAPGQSQSQSQPDASSQAPAVSSQASPAPPEQAQAQNDQAPQDSQPMNEVLRQLFNR